MLISALIGSLNGAVAKYLSAYMDPVQIVFYRNLLGMLIILYSFKRFNVKVDKTKLHLLFLRGIFGATAMVLFFYTIAFIPLGEAVVLNKTSPFFVTIIAYYLLKEKIDLKTFFALFIGFIGIVFVTKPLDIELSIDHILGVLGGFFAAAAYATIKKIKNIYDARLIMLSFMGIGSLIPLALYLFTPFVEFKIHSDIFVWLLIIFMAIISTASQWFLTKAYSIGKASTIGIVSYSNIPFAIGFGVLLGDALPGFLTIIGILLITLGGILVSKK
ncbi:MAG: Riboflavin transporter [Arcobacter lacus]|nr:MAG: Riboflavin transporter [Arcobacter lacus]